LQNVQLLAAGELEEIVDRAGTEKENCVRFAARYASEPFLVCVGGPECAVRNYFGYLRAEISQGGWQVGIGAIAAGKKNALILQVVSELLGKSYAEMCLRSVLDAKADLFCFIFGRRPDNRYEWRRRIFCDGATLARGASGYGLNRIGAGEHDPIKAIPLQ
jgi:hypothetical protein